jgi:ADP-heptose:LPS heptosyltransferase
VDSALSFLPPNSRVAVVRLRSLGDCVLTTPALRVLKAARPDLRVAVVVEPRFRDLFSGNPDIAEILAPDTAFVRRFAPELCLNFHGGTRSAWITAISGAPWRAGFAHFRYHRAYNLRIPRAQEILGVERKVHTAEHLASAMFWLGAPMCDIPRARLFAPAAPHNGHYAVLHPFATAAAKTWPAANFAAAAEHLAHTGLEPVIIGAGSDNFSAFRRFRTVAGAPLAEIQSLLAGASLFLGNDSGPAHMAAAFGLPVVVLFSASDPEIWGPWRTVSQVLRAPATVDQVLEAMRCVSEPRPLGSGAVGPGSRR